MKEQEQTQKLNSKDHRSGDKIISGAKKVWNVVKWPLGIIAAAFISTKIPHGGDDDDKTV